MITGSLNFILRNLNILVVSKIIKKKFIKESIRNFYVAVYFV